MKNFKYPLFIEGTESELTQIVKELVELGYKEVNGKAQLTSHGIATNHSDKARVGYIGGAGSAWGGRIPLKASQKSLILALAAMVDDDKFYKGEMVVALEDCDPGKQFTKDKIYKTSKDSHNGILDIAFDDKGSTINGWNKFRKATKEEIVKYFESERTGKTEEPTYKESVTDKWFVEPHGEEQIRAVAKWFDDNWGKKDNVNFYKQYLPRGCYVYGDTPGMVVFDREGCGRIKELSFNEFSLRYLDPSSYRRIEEPTPKVGDWLTSIKTGMRVRVVGTPINDGGKLTVTFDAAVKDGKIVSVYGAASLDEMRKTDVSELPRPQPEDYKYARPGETIPDYSLVRGIVVYSNRPKPGSGGISLNPWTMAGGSWSRDTAPKTQYHAGVDPYYAKAAVKTSSEEMPPILIKSNRKKYRTVV